LNDNMKQFGSWIDRLIAGDDLSLEAAHSAFTLILNDEQTAIHQGAFLAAITAKGPTPDEIAGAWKAIVELDTATAVPHADLPLVDNCGTGMDGFKTFNISTAAAVVAAAGGVPMARHGARAITSHCGTVDLCEALGVDVECPADLVRSSIETVGIGLFNGMSPQVHPKALFRILSQMRFGSILNIAASLANPARPSLGVRGVYAEKMVVPVAETMRAIGYKRAMVFHGSGRKGFGGMDELSPAGTNFVAELLPGGKIVSYTLAPGDLGLEDRADLSAIAGGNDPEREAVRLLRILSGRENGALRDVVCINTAPIFYVAGKVLNLREGVDMAEKVIDAGLALKKVNQWVVAQNRDAANAEGHLNTLLNAA
jgi:anthranilate phosphoribosyltransferase